MIVSCSCLWLREHFRGNLLHCSHFPGHGNKSKPISTYLSSHLLNLLPKGSSCSEHIFQVPYLVNCFGCSKTWALPWGLASNSRVTLHRNSCISKTRTWYSFCQLSNRNYQWKSWSHSLTLPFIFHRLTQLVYSSREGSTGILKVGGTNLHWFCLTIEGTFHAHRCHNSRSHNWGSPSSLKNHRRRVAVNPRLI